MFEKIETGIAPSSSPVNDAVRAGKQVWLVAGVGRFVPRRLWEVIDSRLDGADEPWEADEEVVPLGLVTKVVGARGLEDVADALRHVDTPIAPELFKEGIL